ncbi:MAG TPA: SUF system Fe-S cluster assembly regulator [Casimicrobiaceae bacterium]|nr:SUF system Fe-S cluster assembly regulator [Casimicrobiaceae bacterium]
MLRVSKLADYGTVVMAAMAREPQRVHSAAEVATRIGLAIPTVSKILKTLARSGLVTSTRGVKGGYRLLRAPAEISIAQIIGAVDGPIGVTECSTMRGMCMQEGACALRGNWLTINHIVLEALEGVTLEQMTHSLARTLPRPVARRAVGDAKAIG